MDKTCGYEGCDSQKVIARGLCAKHYGRAVRRGEIPGQAPCTVEDCAGKAYARGLCSLHYVREKTGYGDHFCEDCGTRIPARTKGGSYPDRCPECQQRHKRQVITEKRLAAATSPVIRCSSCEQTLDRELFYESQRQNGGWCIECHKQHYRREFDRTPRPCEWCGSDFTPVHPMQKFCSKSHKSAAASARAKGRENKAGRVCKACGEPLALTRRAGTLYCDNKCAVRMRGVDGRMTPEMRRSKRVVKTYGLTLEQYDELKAAAANTGCAICHTLEPGQQGWALDHCHTQGHIRGVLCGACNMALGMLKDDPARLRAAADYLERHQ